jgi:hypothetical protein
MIQTFSSFGCGYAALRPFAPRVRNPSAVQILLFWTAMNFCSDFHAVSFCKLNGHGSNPKSEITLVQNKQEECCEPSENTVSFSYIS